MISDGLTKEPADHFEALAVAIGVLGYGVLLGVLAANSTTAIYGFDVGLGPIAALKIVNQMCAIMIAAILFLIVPAIDAILRQFVQRLRRGTIFRALVMVPVTAMLLALAFSLVTWAALHLALGDVGQFSHPAVVQVWCGFAADVALLVMFALFVHALARRWWLTPLLFIAYVAAVLGWARLGHDITFLGFGTSSPLGVTLVSGDAVGDDAAWLVRGYWLLIVLAMLAAIAGLPHRRTALSVPFIERWRRLASFGAGLILLAIAAGYAVHLDTLRSAALARYGRDDAIVRQVAARTPKRPRVLSVALRVRALPAQHVVGVEGEVAIRNDGATEVRELLLAHAETFEITNLSFGNAPARSLGRSGEIEAFALPRPLAPGEQSRLRYDAKIAATQVFDTPARTIVMHDAVFLGTDNLVPLPRSGGCIASDESACEPHLSYQLRDTFPARIDIEAPSELTVVAAERTASGGGRSRWHIDVPAAGLGNLLVAAARFRQASCVPDCPSDTPRMYLAPYSHHSSAVVGRYAAGELAALTKLWGAPPARGYWLAEMPSSWGEAVSFLGGAAIGEHNLLDAASPDDLAIPAKLVISHEIAHQWWGYGIVPEHGPGSAFVLESVSQFAGLARLRAQGLMTNRAMIETTARLSDLGRRSSRARPARLEALQSANWQAYYQGPLALAFVDLQTGEGMSRRLGDVTARLAERSPTPTPPTGILNALRTAMPRRSGCVLTAALESDTMSMRTLRQAKARCRRLSN